MVIAVVAVGAALAGFVQGLSGFAFGLVAWAVWAWALDPALAGPLVVFGSLVGQAMAIPQLRLNSLPRALPFVAGGLLGVPLGIWLLPMLDARLFKGGLGVLLVVWCPLMVFANKLPHITFGGRAADALAGGIGGIMGGLGGLTGPVPTLWCTMRGWDRHQARGVFQVFNLVMHATTFAGYLLAGKVTMEAGRLFLVVVPAMLLPALLGARAYRHVSDAQFRRLVLGLLNG
jgi:uncharacterized membrane protein YfcA